MHGEIMIQDQTAKTAVILAMVGRVKSGLIDTWFVDKNEGDNYVVILLWFATSPVHCLVMTPTNLEFNELQRMNELVC